MRKSKFSESRIVGIAKDAESGIPVPNLLARDHSRRFVTFWSVSLREGFIVHARYPSRQTIEVVTPASYGRFSRWAGSDWIETDIRCASRAVVDTSLNMFRRNHRGCGRDSAR